jgi:hypothetical protein
MKKKIAWSSVTWYSKAIAASVFVLLPLVAFYAGVRLGFFMGSNPPQLNIYLPSSAGAYRTYSNADIGFSLEYPASWEVSENSDQYTVASFVPAGSLEGQVKVFLQKNTHKDIYALKAAMDKKIGASAESWVRHTGSFDALVYAGYNGSAVMYVPMSEDAVLGITGPNNSATLRVLNSFGKF